jgi:serine/threonine protein kinase
MASHSGAPTTTLTGITICELLGKGATGKVYRGHTADGEVIAVKLLRDEFADDPLVVARLVQECKILAGLTGPHVVGVKRLVMEDGLVGVIMEYVDGGDVRALLHREGNLAPGAAGTLLSQVLDGLATAHAAGIIHRDVKPENVLLDASGTVKLTDFGIARVLAGPTTTKGTGLIGSPDYMAPELAGRKPVTAAVDVYGAGCMFYELLTGVSPFVGGSPAAVLLRHVQQLPVRPSELPDTPWDLLQRMLAKEPNVRPTASDALQELASLQASLDLVPPLPVWISPPDQHAGAGGSFEATQDDVFGEADDADTARTRSRPSAPPKTPPTPIPTPRAASATSRLKSRAAILAAACVVILLLLGSLAFRVWSPRHAAAASSSARSVAGGAVSGTGPVLSSNAPAGSPFAGASPFGTAGATPQPTTSKNLQTSPTATPTSSTKLPPSPSPVAVPPTIASSTLAQATVGLPYRASLSASGGQAPYVWGLLSGRLPGGLSLDQSGTISGTPGEAYSGNFTVTVRDAAGLVATAQRGFTSVLLVGDVNRDGTVDCGDVALLQSAWDWGEGKNAGNRADLNGDASVNALDLSIVLSHWTGPAGACPS